jgi:hypothetical protein
MRDGVVRLVGFVIVLGDGAMHLVHFMPSRRPPFPKMEKSKILLCMSGLTELCIELSASS